MSLPRKTTITCPHCNTQSEFILWGSLNADLDPDAQQQLLDGSLFRFRCHNCGHEGYVNYSTLYHDMTNCVMVCYTTPDAIDNAIATFQDLINNNSAMSQNYRYRIVTSQNCLREKALIFKCGLDDRVIEVAKVLLLAHADQQHPDAVFSEVFFNESDGKFFFEFIGDQYMRAEVPRSFYDNLSESLSDKLPPENTFLVDFAWAKSFIG